MTFPQVDRLFAYWKTAPPEHEMLHLLTRCFTSWEPQVAEPGSAASLEAQWNAGALNPAEMFEMFKKTGGKIAR